ncbi:hypothetical protein [Erysipelatoclostridium sp. An173]|uniref:hypothetical protein n=1 Tax=Erysipelatoclostridium sp. An173 TaxID=1965571 RepID=UPI00320A56AE
MDNKINRYDLTSADAKIIGFDFQYFYFINELLKLQTGQSIGYEAKDDVHIEIYSNSKIITKLIQLKHTVQKNANGNPSNLTERDDDLWKTLSNWCKVICDNNRMTINKQRSFIKDTEFIFATNKKIDKNAFISNINKLQVKKIKFLELQNYLSELENSTKDLNVKKHIHDVTMLNDKVLRLFFGNLNFVDTGDEIIESIKSSIQGKMIAKNRVNDVFNALFSELKQDFFKNVKTGNHQIISYDDWLKKYTCIFEQNRNTTLPIRTFNPVFPKNLFEQPFVRELIEIGEINDEDLLQVTEFSEFMLTVRMNLEKWYHNGEITYSDLDKFHKQAINIWKNTHKKAHRLTKSDINLNNKNALACLDDIRSKQLKILTTDLGIDLSNGEFYYLANESKIGWKVNWEVKY